MEALIVGCGSIGERHLKNLLMLGKKTIAICDTNGSRVEYLCKQFPISGYTKIESALAQRPEVTLVCTPTNEHLAIALAAAKSGSHIFIEKPISDHLSDEIYLLEEEIMKQGLQCLVGCNMRFHPALIRIHEALRCGIIGEPLSLRSHFGHYLPKWRPKQDYWLTYSAKRSLGGGIILDAIHEIDYVQWFMGKARTVFCYSGKVSDLKVDVPDCAEILLKFSNDRIASIHLDYIDLVKRRSCDLVGNKGTMVWHSTGKEPEDATLELLFDQDSRKVEHFKVDPNGPYLMEMKHLFDCVKGSVEPILNIKTATIDLEISLAAIESGRIGSPVTLNL